MGLPQNIQVIELTNADRQFYPTLGPFLANRDVHKALGGVPWDEDTKTWFIARTPRKVHGFIGVAARGNRVIVESLYTLPGAKPELAAQLLDAAVQRFGGRELHAMARHAIADVYTAAGFETVSTTKGFATLIRPATPENA